MKLFFLPTVFLTLLTFSAMGQNNNEVVFTFDHVVGTTPLVLNETVFEIWNGKKLLLTRAAFYISNIALKQSDNTNTALEDQYLLVNPLNTGVEYNLGNYNTQNTTHVLFNLGVPEAVNHADPSLWPNNHPLALQNPSMHWGWTGGYRFMVIEGLIDNDEDGVPETVFQFHNLGDALLTPLELGTTVTPENGTLHINFKVDYKQLFDNLPIQGSVVAHGSEIINKKMMTNAANQNFMVVAAPTVPDNDVFGFQEAILLSPNPSLNNTQIDYNFSNKKDLNILITNSLGQVVFSQKELPTSGLLPVATAIWPSGSYNISFFDRNELLQTRQLLVQH